MQNQNISRFNQEFPLDPGIIYLNHAAVSPWPQRTADAITAFSQENLHFGAQQYPRWLETENLLREQFKTLINAPSVDDIAILKNTSEALSTVAYGLPWQKGDNIVLCKQEFPSNRIVWESLQKYGVTVTLVDIADTDDPESKILEQITPQTRLIAISAVQFGTGLRMNLLRLGEHCKNNHILFCVDAIQALGALRFDVQKIHADFVMADGHKWMLGPEGVALFYCRSELREQLSLHQYGWHMLENPGAYDELRWQPAKTARRFECGSPNMLGIHAMSASLSLLLEAGIAKIEEQVLIRTNAMINLVRAQPSLTLISDARPERLSGIITFRHNTIKEQHLYNSLMKNNVICAPRGGGIRFSPHFYTQPDLVETAIELSALTD